MGAGSGSAIDRALTRLLAVVQDGLRHGYFEFVLTCEIIGQERRRMTFKAGKSYQFVIPQEECMFCVRPGDSGPRSAPDEDSLKAGIVPMTSAPQARGGSVADPELSTICGSTQ